MTRSGGNTLLHVPRMALVGACGRNVGKSLVACAIIRAFGERYPVCGLKVICSHGGKCHRGVSGCGMCRFEGAYELVRETNAAGGKDTARMLRAGSQAVYLLKSRRESLGEAFSYFLEQVAQNALIVCESNSLRRHVVPGVFLFAGGPESCRDKKPSAVEVLPYVDGFVRPDQAANALAVVTNATGELSFAPNRTLGGTGMALTLEQKQGIIEKHGRSPGKVLNILMELQYASDQSYIDQETAALVADELGLTKSRVYELVSYYAMLEERPQARHVLEVCNSAPCQWTKADGVTALLKELLGVELNQPTPDGMFLYRYIPCAGACDIGPIIKVQGEVYGNLDRTKVEELIRSLRLQSGGGV